jgi:L,D-peptidoglycan transpeptidase YkuD (ErfK/YbiS/YcfS/YnhG family)
VTPKSTALHIRVSLQTQSLELWQDDDLLKTYPVSTSRFGAGTEEGSFKTPLGTFEVCEKFGDQVPLHTVFQSRQPIGTWNPAQFCETDLIIARILRLGGLDSDNANSYERFIYIHGTNHEDLIGTAASQGCVRMKNCDVIELYDLVPTGTSVRISEG